MNQGSVLIRQAAALHAEPDSQAVREVQGQAAHFGAADERHTLVLPTGLTTSRRLRSIRRRALARQRAGHTCSGQNSAPARSGILSFESAECGQQTGCRAVHRPADCEEGTRRLRIWLSEFRYAPERRRHSVRCQLPRRRRPARGWKRTQRRGISCSVRWPARRAGNAVGGSAQQDECGHRPPLSNSLSCAPLSIAADQKTVDSHLKSMSNYETRSEEAPPGRCWRRDGELPSCSTPPTGAR